MATILITGNTYPVKDQLKALGGKWDPGSKGWRVPANKAEEARRVMAAAPTATKRTSSRGRRGRKWAPCGYPGCSPGYCDECDGEGLYG